MLVSEILLVTGDTLLMAVVPAWGASPTATPHSEQKRDPSVTGLPHWLQYIELASDFRVDCFGYSCDSPSNRNPHVEQNLEPSVS